MLRHLGLRTRGLALSAATGAAHERGGLLEAAANEAELAAVMAHETGHVVARHSARSMVAAYGVEQVAALAGGTNPGLLTKVTTTIAGRGVLLSHTRGEETEADEYGARYSSTAGYDPRGFITFFEKLEKSEGSSPAILNYLSDHPATGDRIAHINAFIAAQKLGGTNLGADAYAKLRKRLGTLPASPAKAPAGAPPAPPAGAPPAAPAGAPPPAGGRAPT